MATLVLGTKITQNSSRTMAQKIIETEYGDGAFQRAGIGINSRYDEWTLEWSGLNETDRDTFWAFYEAHGLVKPFDWTPVNGSEQVFIFAEAPSETHSGFSTNITAKIRQVFEYVAPPTPSPTPTISVTPSVTQTPTPTPSSTVTPTITPTSSITPSVTVTPTPSVTSTVTPTPSVTVTITPSITPSITPTISVTPSITPTITVTPSVTPETFYYDEFASWTDQLDISDTEHLMQASVTISGDNVGAIGTFGKTTGKWYVEFVMIGSVGRHGQRTVGIGSIDYITDGYTGLPDTGICMQDDGFIYAFGDTPYATSTFLDNGDYIKMAIDFDNNKLWFGDNYNGWIGGGDPASGSDATITFDGDVWNWYTCFNLANNSNVTSGIRYNSGYNQPFIEMPPVGFNAGWYAYSPPPTPTPTISVTPTHTVTPTPTTTITPTITPTISVTPTITPTISVTPSITPTITPTMSVTPTMTPTPSVTSSPPPIFYDYYDYIAGDAYLEDDGYLLAVTGAKITPNTGLGCGHYGKGSGKHYIEFQMTYDGDGNPMFVGISDYDYRTGYTDLSVYTNGFFMGIDGVVYQNGSSVASGTVIGSGDVIKMAIDMEAGKCWFGSSIDGWIGGGDPAAGTSPTISFTPNAFESDARYIASFLTGTTSDSFLIYRSGNETYSPFAMTPPSGFTPGWYSSV